ncbi:kinase-like protein [Panaeolus papilionaceus]|nr:kinase-like protein [Panaeolus papilionaceus]
MSTSAMIAHRKATVEPQERYKPGGYHPVSPGELYKERYRVIHRLGWGMYSTVWLVQDTSNQTVAAMKVLIGDMAIQENEGGFGDELRFLKVIQERNPNSEGYHHICQLLDSFTCKGPNGDHVCLIVEPMKLTAFDIYRSLPGAMSLPLLKRISKHILTALQYLHEDCSIIHTDIKGDNILLTGEPLKEGQLEVQLDDEYMMSTVFKLSDFGAANMLTNRIAQLIQPESLRSPEVIIGAEWDTKADIWNLGCLLYEFARGAKLFDPHWNTETSGLSPTQTHLSQMTGLLGNFPLQLLQKGSKSDSYFNEQGALLQGANTYSITLHDLLNRAGYTPQETSEIADFLTPMLTIDPGGRWTAAQLLKHPWLSGVE